MDKKPEGLVPVNYEMAHWYCLTVKKYVFGVVLKKMLVNKYAGVQKLPDENWQWIIFGSRFQGVESSKKRAMKRIKETYEAAIKLKKDMKK